MRVTRRHLQLALGCLWLLDAGLQFQPFMFGTGFAGQIIGPAGDGQPQFVAGPVHWGARIIAAHPVAWNIPFAGIQLLIGLGLLVPRTVRPALAVSVLWSLGVWFFGEGLSGLASGHTSLLTGAPGAALLYGVIGVAAWPARGRGDESPARWLLLAWATIWLGGAVFQALPGQNTGSAIAGVLADGADGAPGWLQRLEGSVGAWISHHGTLVVVALVAVEAVIGLAVLVRRSRGVGAAAGVVLIAAIWVVAQDLGQLYSGQATDPNSGPLILLMAIALSPIAAPWRRGAGSGRRSRGDGAGRRPLGDARPCGCPRGRDRLDCTSGSARPDRHRRAWTGRSDVTSARQRQPCRAEQGPSGRSDRPRRSGRARRGVSTRV